MRQRIGVVLENVGLAILRLSDRVRGTDHGPSPNWIMDDVAFLSQFTIGDYDHEGNEYRKPKIVPPVNRAVVDL